MTKIMEWFHDFLWGAPALILILGVGLYLSVRLDFVQFRLLPQALKEFFHKLRPCKEESSGVSSVQALCTALAATVGTGNLVGVAGAISLGGPGAVFWMWICGFLGMATKYAEAVLAVRYRIRTADGYAGGPMYVITQGLDKRLHFLASAYCIFGIIAAFGVGNATQVNAVVSSVNSLLLRWGTVDRAHWNFWIGMILAVLMGKMLFGGAKQIAVAAERLVPFAAAIYIFLCLGLLAVRAEEIPHAFTAIIQGAISPRAVTGGMLGSAFQALRIGCSRGVFTNEAGMGTASIAHGSAQTAYPAQQGLMGIVEVFLDTILICTLTALVILTSGVPIPYGSDAGGELTVRAFASVYGDFAYAALTVCLTLFAVATILGWGLYGARCSQFLFGNRSWKWFAAAQSIVIVIGAVADTAAVWQFSEVLNGLMVIPNLIALAVLTPEVRRLTKEYKKSGGDTAGGGNYADFHQCKPL